MTNLSSRPLPPTARHDADGNHVPPPWPGGSSGVVKGSLVEMDQRRKAQFEAHLAEHRRKGEPAVVKEH